MVCWFFEDPVSQPQGDVCEPAVEGNMAKSGAGQKTEDLYLSRSRYMQRQRGLQAGQMGTASI